MLPATFICQHPRSTRHRRLMSHMLPMAAGKIRHPVAVFILMIAYNWLIHVPAGSSRGLRLASLTRMGDATAD
jgi:hypothetical protein